MVPVDNVLDRQKSQIQGTDTGCTYAQTGGGGGERDYKILNRLTFDLPCWWFITELKHVGKQKAGIYP
jgi:hypothetical protein